jgi:hypothetical protein
MTGLSAGGRDLYGLKSGYISTRLRYPVNISTGVVAGPYIDALPRSRAAGYGTIILDWKRSQPVESATGCTGPCLGWEFDLFVKTPSGGYIGYSDKGDLMASPYIYYPRDSFDDYLPMETIVIGSSAADGVYKVYVDRFPYAGSWNLDWTNSQASVVAYKAGIQLSGHYYAPPSACGSTNRYWYVGDITKSGTTLTWTSLNSCTNTQP